MRRSSATCFQYSSVSCTSGPSQPGWLGFISRSLCPASLAVDGIAGEDAGDCGGGESGTAEGAEVGAEVGAAVGVEVDVSEEVGAPVGDATLSSAICASSFVFAACELALNNSIFFMVVVSCSSAVADELPVRNMQCV